MFFDNDIFKSDDEDDGDLELEFIANKLNPSEKVKRTKKPIDQKSDSEESDYCFEDEFQENQKKIPEKYSKSCKNTVKLNPEELALGTLMIQSQKTKRDILDDAWNRYTHGDDELLPSWFRKDEEKFFKKHIPVPQELVNQYKKQLKEIDAQPIKKVAEAKARKRKRALKRLEKARKKAESITNSADMSEKEKIAHIKRYCNFD